MFEACDKGSGGVPRSFFTYFSAIMPRPLLHEENALLQCGCRWQADRITMDGLISLTFTARTVYNNFILPGDF